ncbi:hypothetical protein C8R44DRAFT_942549 [Mycena epipterygia]|nr:hypothetical protein C8R44DRAFT_942549 [Mycena epipterygia]
MKNLTERSGRPGMSSRSAVESRGPQFSFEWTKMNFDGWDEDPSDSVLDRKCVDRKEQRLKRLKRHSDSGRKAVAPRVLLGRSLNLGIKAINVPFWHLPALATLALLPPVAPNFNSFQISHSDGQAGPVLINAGTTRCDQGRSSRCSSACGNACMRSRDSIPRNGGSFRRERETQGRTIKGELTEGRQIQEFHERVQKHAEDALAAERTVLEGRADGLRTDEEKLRIYRGFIAQQLINVAKRIQTTADRPKSPSTSSARLTGSEKQNAAPMPAIRKAIEIDSDDDELTAVRKMRRTVISRPSRRKPVYRDTDDVFVGMKFCKIKRA